MKSLPRTKKLTRQLMIHSQIIGYFVSLLCEILEFKFENSAKE